MNTPSLAVFLFCSVVSVPIHGIAQESPAGQTDVRPAKSNPSKDLIKSLVGSWEGTCRTWFTREQVADESKVKGEIRLILDGRMVRHTYEGSMKDKPRQGEETIAFSSVAKRFEVAWIDTFHMRDGILFSTGEASDRGFTVLGKWGKPGDAPWGWKTVYQLEDADHLTITAYTIKPDGPEGKAVETKYSRVKR